MGNISFNQIKHELKKVDLGYWLSSAFQGQGIVSKSVAQLIQIAFTELDMEKVQVAAALTINPAAVCERLGFVREGIITRAENLNGIIVDHAVYGLNRQQWLAQTSATTIS